MQICVGIDYTYSEKVPITCTWSLNIIFAIDQYPFMMSENLRVEMVWSSSSSVKILIVSKGTGLDLLSFFSLKVLFDVKLTGTKSGLS